MFRGFSWIFGSSFVGCARCICELLCAPVVHWCVVVDEEDTCTCLWLLQEFRVHNVMCACVGCNDEQARRGGGSAESHVQLSMAKTGLLEPDADFLKRLSL